MLQKQTQKLNIEVIYEILGEQNQYIMLESLHNFDKGYVESLLGKLKAEVLKKKTYSLRLRWL